MADGDAAMAEMIRRLRGLGGLVEEAAPDVAREVELELHLQIDAARGPTGTAWKPRRVDGGEALQGAGRSLRVIARGTVILATLDGHYARHSIGAVRGGVRRQILPKSGIPAGIARGIRRALDRKFVELAGREAVD